jgi:NarL family two-component system response regulator LiaR
MSTQRIRVLVVDDHLIVRKGTRALFAEIDNIEIVGEASNGREAVELVATLQPDVVIMDLVMPVMDGVEAIRQISERFPQVRVLALTSFAVEDKVLPAIKAGALGYLLKDVSSEELINALYRVADGEPYLHPSVARKVLNELQRTNEPEPPVETLTQRETEVLVLVAQGLTNIEIAARLNVAEVTVRTHVSNILSKLQLANRVQATLYALREGLTSLGEDSSKPRATNKNPTN